MSPSFILPLLLQSALLPFGVALAVALLMRNSGLPAFAAAAAVPLATLASFFAVHHAQWSPLPHQALDWFPWIALMGMAAVAGITRVSGTWLRAVLRLLVGGLVALMVLAPVAASLELVRLLAVVAASAGLVALAWTVLGSQAQTGGAAALALVIVAGGAGLSLMIDASQSLGQLSGALAMACAACVALGFGTRRIAFNEAASGISVVLLAALLVNAHVYAGFSLLYVALLIAGLAGAAAPAVFHAIGKSGSVVAQHVAAAIIATVPVLIALGLVLKAAQESGGY